MTPPPNMTAPPPTPTLALAAHPNRILGGVVPQGLLEALLNLLEATGLQILEVLEVFLNVTNSHLKEIIPNLGLIKIPLHQHPHRVGGLTLRVPVDLWLLALSQCLLIKVDLLRLHKDSLKRWM